jgi:hypothetical protein
MSVPENIILGDGVFAVNGVDVALTRGGGAFAVEREYKHIEADGDLGPVKGRIRKVKSLATLKMNVLELLPSNLPKFYPAMTLTTSDPAKDVLTGASDISTSDYSTVTWTGVTKDGKEVYIELQNAINLENFEWEIADKEEIVPELTFTAAYLESARTTEPWKIEFAKNVAGDSTPPTVTLIAPLAGNKTQIILTFNEYLHADTLAITDRSNLLSALTNDALGTPTPITITTSANSVQWYNTDTANPFAIVTIASTTFTAGQTVRANMKTSAVKDLASNAVSAATNSDAVVES